MYADWKSLEFEAIRRWLGQYPQTPYGAEAVRHLEPAPTLSAALQLQTATSAALNYLAQHGKTPLTPLPEIRPALKQMQSPGASLPNQAFSNILQVMTAAEALQPLLTTWPALWPFFSVPVSSVPVFSGAVSSATFSAQPLTTTALTRPEKLQTLFAQVFSASGSLREDASPELSALFSKRRAARSQAEKTMQDKLPKLPQGILAQPKVYWHQERAALVLYQKSAAAVPGVRRETLMGGRDVVVEPLEVVALNNQLESYQQQISREQQRILREATAILASESAYLESILSLITWLDLAFAAAELSRAMSGHAPELTETPEVFLDRAYHPLLLSQFLQKHLPQPPVPLSVALSAAQPMLLLTGANTGGKTVVLKTIGLLTTMAFCGLHIPAEGRCRFGHYQKILVDIGDKQSLAHQLSTFAGQVEMLKRLLKETDAHTLVLLDELGTGTDPDEGAALAMAILDELLARGAQALVNTHLPPLKRYAEEKPGVLNAAMRFDEVALKPCYELMLGQSGQSLGLLVAEQRGLAPTVIAQARAYLARLKAK